VQQNINGFISTKIQVNFLRSSRKILCGKMSTSTEEVKISTESSNQPDNDYVKWRKAKKVAVMASFVGKDYLGMQRNPGFKTIEEDLMKAFRDAEIISDEWYENPQKCFFQRASRTDKGVSAARMVMSLKLLLDDNREETISRINSKLPSCIKVQYIKKVTKNFNCKSACDGRTYLYLLPTFAFAPLVPIDDAKDGETPEDYDYKATSSFRMTTELRNRVNDVLKEFIGSRYYHNYTSGKLPLEPSSQRYITEFEIGEPFEKEDMEFAVIKIKGQSFMLHQIRKMIGLAIAVVRGQAPKQTIEKSWESMRIDIPRAPGLGLMLDEIHYDRYNKRFANDGIHEKLSWENVEDEVEAFKKDFIFPEMVSGEKDEKSMFDWLKILPIHGFEQRHFEHSESHHKPLDSLARSMRTEENYKEENKMREENNKIDENNKIEENNKVDEVLENNKDNGSDTVNVQNENAAVKNT